MEKDNNKLNILLNDAVIKHTKGDLKEAEKKYMDILSYAKDNAIVLYLLGTLKAQQNKNDEAINLIKNSIKLDSSNADAHYNLGNIFQNKKQIDLAKNSYIEALKIKPDYLKAHYNLGQILLDQKKYQESIQSYNKVLKIKPNHSDTFNNLGTLYVRIKDYKKSEKNFKKAISINPNSPEYLYNYATLLQEKGNYKSAASTYNKVIKIKPFYPKAHNNLGYVYKKLNKFVDAKKSYETSISQDPNYSLAYNNYGNILDLMCEHEKAIEAYETSITLNPNKLSTRWALMNTFPVIYKDKKEIKNYQKKFSKNTKVIKSFLESNNNLTNDEMLSGVLNSTNFYLHYQGNNNLNDQRKYSILIEKITKKIFSKYHKKLSSKKIKNKIKIGFVSSTCFIDHSVSSVIKNWILKLNKNIFNIFIFHIHDEDDNNTEIFKKKFKNFFNYTDTKIIAEKIYSKQLDLIIFPDIGMDPKMQVLASLRLAPVQCQTLGHPISSCLRNIDYFISSQFMETNGSEKNYSEKLITLPDTGQCFEYPKIQTKLKKIKTKKNELILFNLQSLFKLLPNDDELCLELIKNIPNIKIWFMEGKNTKITKLFEKRMKILLNKNGLDFKKFIVLNKRRSQSDFFELVKKSDIILDSLNWSGNCTTHQAIALDKPVITMPGKYMRARHSYALLKKMQLNELIAYSINDYIKIIKKLSENKKYLEKVILKINKNKTKLFNDLKPIRSLEKFLIEVTNK